MTSGQQLALVVADSYRTAKKAAGLVQVKITGANEGRVSGFEWDFMVRDGRGVSFLGRPPKMARRLSRWFLFTDPKGLPPKEDTPKWSPKSFGTCSYWNCQNK